MSRNIETRIILANLQGILGAAPKTITEATGLAIALSQTKPSPEGTSLNVVSVKGDTDVITGYEVYHYSNDHLITISQYDADFNEIRDPSKSAQ